MIDLRTGVPGSGKTLTAVAELVGMFKADGEGRPVFVHGIPDLALPCIPLPVFSPVVIGKDGKPTQERTLEVDWSAVPDGALVLIDEAQHIFPIRGAGSRVPAYVSFLNTHRHRGIDIWLITQHPKLLDSSVRKLVGRHRHYRRVLGMDRHICYEWDACSENLSFGQAQSTRMSGFPTDAYAAYKSAEIHTKQRFAKPLFVLVPVVGVVAAVVFGPKLWHLAQGIKSGQGIPGGSSAASAPAGGASGVEPGRLSGSDATVAAFAARSGGGGVSAERAPDVVKASAVFEPEGVAKLTASYSRMVPGRPLQPVEVGGCFEFPGGCHCVTNGPAPRVLLDSGILCRAVVRGELAISPSRPRVERDPAQAAPALREPGASAPGGASIAASLTGLAGS